MAILTSNWTPRASKEEDVDADERNGSTLSGKVLYTSNGTGNGHNVLGDSHANGTHEQEVASTHLLNEVQSRNSRGDVDNVGDDGDGESARVETGVLEVLGAVVKDEVLRDTLLVLPRTSFRTKPSDDLRHRSTAADLAASIPSTVSARLYPSRYPSMWPWPGSSHIHGSLALQRSPQ